MRMVKPSDVQADVLGDGRLRLRAPGRTFLLDPDRAAMWIALLHENGDGDAAAAVLASQWGVDRDVLCDEVDEWTRGLCRAGLLELVP